jgi:hypothetical protein
MKNPLRVEPAFEGPDSGLGLCYHKDHAHQPERLIHLKIEKPQP